MLCLCFHLYLIIIISTYWRYLLRFVQCKEGASGPPNNRKFQHVITVKEVTVEATAKKKKDAKNLAFKLMAVKLGEILRLLKPQPGRFCFYALYATSPQQRTIKLQALKHFQICQAPDLYICHRNKTCFLLSRHSAYSAERADQGDVV